MALRLLEAIKAQDSPPEVFEDEDPTVTMPRRLGLSNVVERQIRTYRHFVRRGTRLTDDEVRDLFRLVNRRPDGGEIFRRLGQALGSDGSPGRWGRRLPRSLAMALARRRTARVLNRLFGRRMGGFGRGPFSLEGTALLFIQADPGGEACELVSGLCEAVVARVAGGAPRVVHSLCQARGDSLCRWEVWTEGVGAGRDGSRHVAEAETRSVGGGS
ncbi:MAG: hypothetical protein P8170_21705 [Gemmatimonadota bacterium]